MKFKKINSPPFLLTFGQMAPWWSVWNPADKYSSASPKKFQSDLQSNISHKTTTYIHCVLGRHSTHNPQFSPTLNLFLGVLIFSTSTRLQQAEIWSHRLEVELTRAFLRDQGRLFPTKCYIQWLLKCKGSRGSLGKLIHFPIINLHLRFSVSPLTAVRWLRKKHKKAPQSTCHCSHLLQWLHVSHTAALWLCAQTHRRFWPTSKPLIFTLAELRKIEKQTKKMQRHQRYRMEVTVSAQM